MKKISLILFFFIISISFVINSHATPFSYQLGIPERIPLLPNTTIDIPGIVINTGPSVLIAPVLRTVDGYPGHEGVEIIDYYDIFPQDESQFAGFYLKPGESFEFNVMKIKFPDVIFSNWWDNNVLTVLYGFIPSDESIRWTHHGYLPDISTFGFWSQDGDLLNPTYNFVTIDSVSAAPYIEEIIPAPEPTTMLLLSSGLIGLVGFRRKFIKK